MMNAHVRDNFGVVKVTRSAAGRLVELSATTLADLSSANVTGLMRPDSDNAMTARNRFNGASARVVVPVGADKYDDLGGGLRRGAWVEGDYFHHMASNQTTEWRYLGLHVSTPSGVVSGSVWVEGEYLHYIDADGDERRCRASASGHSDSFATPGSAWVETYVHWIREAGTTEKPGHDDVAHSDGTEHNDSHGDAAHSDGHGDSGHGDSHGDDHYDSHDDQHDDSHTDVAHDDHQDEPAHYDEPHQDDHLDGHLDAHDDSHGDSHTDAAHDDVHSDQHDDSHDDHGDHGDSAHLDQPTVVA
jgi:hypothetical protein